MADLMDIFTKEPRAQSQSVVDHMVEPARPRVYGSQAMLHQEKSNVMADNLPFLEVRLGTQAMVAPFEDTDQDTLQPLVLFTLKDFVTKEVAQVVKDFASNVSPS